MLDRQELRNAVIAKVEYAFPKALVVWTHSGYPDDRAGDQENIEVFEAYGISHDEYERFEDFAWQLQKTVGEPNGFSIMIHDLTQEEIRKYRWVEYQAELAKRDVERHLAGYSLRVAECLVCGIDEHVNGWFSTVASAPAPAYTLIPEHPLQLTLQLELTTLLSVGCWIRPGYNNPKDESSNWKRPENVKTDPTTIAGAIAA